MPGVRGIGRVCRIFSRGLYRALGTEHIRHRRTASADVLMRRLLSLDYVIEHSGLPWLPTEPEKVAAFEALGIERELLPSRLYRGAAGDTRRYFPVKLPVALEAERALFVLRRSRPRHHDGATFVGSGAPRALARAPQARPVRRGRRRRPHFAGDGPGPGRDERLG